MGIKMIIVRKSFTIHRNRQGETRSRLTRPPPRLDHQCPGGQPVGLMGNDRRITPVPTLHRQSLCTLAHHRRVSAFPGWLRQFACTRQSGSSHPGRGASKQSGKEEGEPGRH